MPDSPERPADHGGLRQLPVVDDEPTVRRSLVRMLQAQGFTCFEAGSGREALGVLERIGEAPLVISDMRMPEIDGIGLLEARPPALPRHLGHHAHRHERDDDRGGLPAHGRRRLPAQADLDRGAAGPRRAGAGEARAGAAEPLLPAEPRAPGARAGPADPGALPARRADAGPRARGQGRLHPRTLDPREPVRRGHRRSSSASKGRASTAFGWEESCTTSGRSGPARRCCTSRGCSPTTSSARSPSTPRSARGCCCRWRRSRPTCSGSCARTTSGSTAAGSPTGSGVR